MPVEWPSCRLHRRGAIGLSDPSHEIMLVEGEQCPDQKGLRSAQIVLQVDIHEVGRSQRLEQLEAVQNGNRTLVASIEQALGRSNSLVDGKRRPELMPYERMATIVT